MQLISQDAQVGETANAPEQPAADSLNNSSIAVPAGPPSKPKPYFLDETKALDPGDFPHKPVYGARFPPTTIANVGFVLKTCGINVRYDVIGKRLTFNIPGVELSADSGETAMTEIISLLQLNGLMVGPAREYVAAIGDRNRFNPAADWINSVPWDGMDRKRLIFESVKVAENYPAKLRDALMYRWLLSAVAAALLPEGFRSRGVLTFQGPQGVGKTSWLMSLVPEALRAKLIKVDHHLDASNKDSILGAVSHWIVEIGELDSSFRKDVARLKGFLTTTHDKVRRPYGRDESEYPRRTVFAATVNETNFLVDTTGNTRWWTVEVASLDYAHNVDMQQLFAQLAEDLKAGEQWWLTAEEEQLLDQQNSSYLAVSVVRDRLAEYLDWARRQGDLQELRHMTTTQILEQIGFKAPNTAQVREATPIFRAQFGQRKKVNGKEGWKLPFCADFVSVEQGAR